MCVRTDKAVSVFGSTEERAKAEMAERGDREGGRGSGA